MSTEDGFDPGMLPLAPMTAREETMPIVEASARREALREAAEACDEAKAGALKHYGVAESVGADMAKRRIEALSPAIPAAGGGDEGWRDIASAPKDGTEIICGQWSWNDRTPVWWQYMVKRSATGHWISRTGHLYQPTHWLRTPSPPASAPNPGPGDDGVLLALWQAWHELNAIRARDGVPWWREGRSDVDPAYFSKVVDDCEAAIEKLTGEPPKPWPPKPGDDDGTQA